MKNIIIFIAFICSISSCVPKQDYDKAQEDNQLLKSKLDELENGAERLYQQATEFVKNNEFDKAEQKLKILFDRHAETSQAKLGRRLANQIVGLKNDLAEKNKWESSTSEKSIESYESYISVYPNGKYLHEARIEISNLIKANEETEYQYASSSTVSSTVRDFILKYPNNKNVARLRKKMIQLEVDEIFEDRNTGQLPTFERTNFNNSPNSSVEIENGTGCDLIVRYSGNDVRMIEIPAGATRGVNLSSGSYRIAASACGSNYAGTEILQGSYTSRYYIVTSQF
jgi:outer membrane protein assembly factor BamD (BamD/ComL family)